MFRTLLNFGKSAKNRATAPDRHSKTKDFARHAMIEPMESRTLYSGTPLTGVGVPIFGVSPTGNLYMEKYNSSVQYSSTSLGNPGVSLAANSTPVYDSVNGNVFAIGTNGTLYADNHSSSGWHWYNQSASDPTHALSGQSLQGSPAIQFNGISGNVFVIGTNGTLYADNYDAGHGWIWYNLSKSDPTGALTGQHLQGSPSVAFNGTSGNVFVVGTNGMLYAENYDAGYGWIWYNLSKSDPTGALAGQHLQGSPSAAFNGANGNVFVVSTNGTLYTDNYNTGHGWIWYNQSKDDPTGVLAGQHLQGSPSAAFFGASGNVFVIGTNGTLYADNYDAGYGWIWYNQSKDDPTGIVPKVTFGGSPTALVATDSTTDVFLKGSDGTLFNDHYSPSSGWQWVGVGNFGEPTPTGPVWSKPVSWHNFSSDPLFAPGGPSVNDIAQGQVGDCWFMASLSATARQDPNLIRKDITQRSDGTYDVYFHQGSSIVDIHVDGELPVDWWGGVAYAGLGQDNCTWVAIMEKAFTYFRNQSIAPAYPTIASGGGSEALKDIGATDVTEVLGSVSNATQLFSDASIALAQGKAVDFGTGGASGPLVGDHEYTLVGVRDSNSTGLQVELRNPWSYNPSWTPNNSNYDATNDGYIWVSCSSILHQLDEFVTANV